MDKDIENSVAFRTFVTKHNCDIILRQRLSKNKLIPKTREELLREYTMSLANN